MKRIFSVFALAGIALVSSCSKNKTETPAQKVVFIDNFIDNRNGWSFSDPANMASGLAGQGVYEFNYNGNAMPVYFISQDVGLNPANDFTISSGLVTNGNTGFLFGYNSDPASNTNGYSFTIDANGNYALYDLGGNGNGNGGAIVAVVPPATSPFVNLNQQWNDLRLEQRGGQWIGYVNNTQVFSVQALPMLDNEIGFIDFANSDSGSDYIQASWLQ